MNAISLGYSPCPNDTFIFHGLVHGLVDTDIVFQRPLLEDVETLNSWAMAARLDVTKLSFHALGHVLDDYCVLNSGSALGRGCGPLLVARDHVDLDKGSALTIGIPGKYTTASLLFRMYAPQCTSLVEMRFEKIIESVADGLIDAGVIIHESRFTYGQKNLISIQDLGSWWEETSGQPIPLGCIAARRNLGGKMIAETDRAIRLSLEKAYDDPQACLKYIRNHAQELDENVIREHINLYVNDFSVDLGEEGMRAITTFLRLGRERGILPKSNQPLTY